MVAAAGCSNIILLGIIVYAPALIEINVIGTVGVVTGKPFVIATAYVPCGAFGTVKIDVF